MKIISVVRDFEMYNRLVKNNKFNHNADFIAFDNNKENKFISVRYNEFLNNYDYSKPDWFVFCHEDWEAKEDFSGKLKNLNKQFLYGPIGVDLLKLGFLGIKFYFGSIIHSKKDGSEQERKGFRLNFSTVGTFDCQCLIVHSTIVEQYNLRFDENLSWDLYVEDFCISARENHSIKSKILQIECQHYSKGDLQPRYFKQLSYLSEKYKNASKTYVTTVPDTTLGKPFKKHITLGNELLYQSKITKSNRRLIKICKIPVYSKNILHQ